MAQKDILRTLAAAGLALAVAMPMAASAQTPPAGADDGDVTDVTLPVAVGSATSILLLLGGGGGSSDGTNSTGSTTGTN